MGITGMKIAYSWKTTRKKPLLAPQSGVLPFLLHIQVSSNT